MVNDVIVKNLERRNLSLITCVGPKCNHIYHYKEEAEGETDKQRRRQAEEEEAEIRVICLQMKKCLEPRS